MCHIKSNKFVVVFFLLCFILSWEKVSAKKDSLIDKTITTLMPPAPSNDDPSGAITLTPAASCTYATYTNANATASTCGTIPVPGCANYGGGDVWFKVTVPATTGFAIDTQTGGVTDGGMAVYSGTACGAMTLISCDED